jgi:hypothetical protein
VRSCHHADAGAAPVIRFETPPGRQAHVGFAQFRFDWDTRYALLVVLGYSRLLWCRFYRRQDMRTLQSGIEAALLALRHRAPGAALRPSACGSRRDWQHFGASRTLTAGYLFAMPPTDSQLNHALPQLAHD